jgi:hypothetical protein
MIAFGPSPERRTPAAARCRMQPAAGSVRSREVVLHRSIFMSEVLQCSRVLLAA